MTLMKQFTFICLFFFLFEATSSSNVTITNLIEGYIVSNFAPLLVEFDYTYVNPQPKDFHAILSCESLVESNELSYIVPAFEHDPMGYFVFPFEDMHTCSGSEVTVLIYHRTDHESSHLHNASGSSSEDSDTIGKHKSSITLHPYPKQPLLHDKFLSSPLSQL